MLWMICTAFGQKIDPTLTAELAKSSNSRELHPIVVVMGKQYEQADMSRKTQYMDKQTRRDFVINEMKKFTKNLQSDVMLSLEGCTKSGAVEDIHSFWAFNGFSCNATAQVIEAISLRDDIMMICSDKERNMLPEEWKPVLVEGMKGNAWNVEKVNANQVWTFYGNSGYTGDGVVVAVIDTGVNYNHGDIANNMWDGGSAYPYHGYDFVNEDNNPMDDHGHGTHCSGTVAGYGTNGTQTGMAPGAKIMALKVLNSSGRGSDSDIVDAIEFAVEHGADVMSLSLGASGVGGYYFYRETFETVLAAGIPAAVAAGNDGDMLGSYPIPNNIGAPGNCPPPYLHPDQANILPGGLSAVISTGATDSYDVHTYFTSVGPATWTQGSYIGSYYDYPYTAGSSTEIGLIRPDVAAPGQNITSLYYGNNTGYTSMSGTSMATPCNAGVIALMLEANPELTPAEILEILEYSAVRCEGSTSKNNYTGSGRIDALAAITNVSTSCDTPADFMAVRNGNSVNLTWTAAQDVSSYVIYRDGDVIASNVNGTSYTDNDVSFPGSYVYFMKSNCSDGTLSLKSGDAVVACHNITCDVIPGAVITTSHTIADVGAMVTVTVTPEDGFALSTLYYINGSGNRVNISTETMQFEMPSSDVMVSATLYEPQLNVTATVEGENVNVNWNGSRAVGYDLVRAKTNANGTSTTDVVTLANGTSATQYTDSEWINAGNGYYKWGVRHAQQRSSYEIEIGTGTGTTEYNPSRFYYCYSLTQQIYTSEEIGMFGQINSIGFNIATAYSDNRNIAVYMKCVDGSTFASGSSWIPVSDSDKVFEGVVYSGNTGWLTITLDEPFLYEYGNLMICVDDNTGSWKGQVYFYQTPVSSSAIYVYSDPTNYDPSNPGVTGTVTSYRPNIKLGMDDIFPRTFWSNVISNTNYSITIADGIEHGTITAPTSTYVGNLVTVEVTPEEDFVLNELYYIDVYGNQMNIDIATKQFVMPDSDITIYATFGFATLLVTAEESGDNVDVSWSNMNGDRGLTYSIYRAKTNETGTQTIDRVQLVEGLTSSPYTDNTWNETTGGYHKWGVRATQNQGDDRGSEELTVYDGTITNSYIPAYIYYFDAYTRSQYVIPASDLVEMDGSNITSLKYYRNTSESYTTGTTVDVYLAEVDNTTISEFFNKDDATLVYNGLMTFQSNGECTITFDTPYLYSGGNLLVGIENNNTADYKSVSYYGQNVSGASVCGYTYSSPSSITPTQRNFIPKTTFTYEESNSSAICWSNVILNPTFNVSVDPYIVNGVVTAPSIVDYGTTVTVEATPEEGYFLSSLYYTGGDQGHPMYINPRTKQFTMPLGDVTIHAVFTMESLMTMAENNDEQGNTKIIRWGNEIANLHYDNDYAYTGYGWGYYSGIMYWGIMIPSEDLVEYEGKALTAVQYIARDNHDFIINIYEGGDNAPETLIHTQDVHAYDVNIWSEFVLDDVVTIDATKNLWITMYHYYNPDLMMTYPGTAGDNMGDHNGRWLSPDGVNWYDIEQYDYHEITWKLRGCFTDITDGSKERKAVSFVGKKGNADDKPVYVKNENPDNIYVAPIQHRATKGNDIYMAKFDLNYGTVGEVQTIATDVSGNEYVYECGDIETGYYKFAADNDMRWSNATLRSDDFNINIAENIENGTISANLTNALFNQEITITVEPETDYLLTNLYYVTDNNDVYYIDINTLSFVMPASNVTIYAEFVFSSIDEIYVYAYDEYTYLEWFDSSVTYYNDHTYTVYIGEYDYNTGNIINVETLGTESPNYYDDYTWADRADGIYKYGISRTGSDVVFWSGKVNKNMYEITVAETEHGTIEAPLAAIVDELVYFTITPDNGYIISSVYLTEDGLDARGQTYMFYMPAYDVTINVEFEVAPLTVTATEIDAANVKVEWMGANDKGTREDLNYNVYRKNLLGNNNPTCLGNVAGNEYIDGTWNEASWGVYQWGVQYNMEGRGTNRATYDFEDGTLQGWTTIDADGDGYNWMNSMDKLPDNYIGYNGSHYCALSQSYDNETGVLYPDNYLVSPEMIHLDGSSINFYVCAQDENYSAEHYGVAISTSLEPTAYDFTTIAEWTIGSKGLGAENRAREGSRGTRSQSTWQEITVDLSDYSGDAWVAIRHFNCNDMFFLDVDDITITNGADEVYWSNTIEKNMWTNVTGAVSTNDGRSVEGTNVYFWNTLEPDYNYYVTLDEMGTFGWTDFRTGVYEYNIYKDGYNYIYNTMEITEDNNQLAFVLEEITYNPENLFVSNTGWAMWNPVVTANREIVGYYVALDNGNSIMTTEPYMQHDVTGFEDGSVHTTWLMAYYTTGYSSWQSYSWTYWSCDNYQGATDFTAENVDGAITLNWTMPEDDRLTNESGWYYYDDGVNTSAIGTGSGQFWWAVMFPGGSYDGNMVSKVQAWDYMEMQGIVSIFQGGDTAPKTLLTTDTVSFTGSSQFVEFELSNPAIIDPTQNVWVVFYNESGATYPAAVCANTGDANGRWVSTDNSTWEDLTSYGLNYTFMIRALFENSSNILGTMVWRNGELLTHTPLAPSVTTFVDDSEDASGTAEYCIRLVYRDDYYSMSCEQCAITGDGLHWHANPYLYESNMTVTGVIQIDGIEQYTTDLEVGAFCGAECRGAQIGQYFSPTGRYILNLMVYGQSGDEITFRLYDHSQEMELEVECYSQLTFEPDAIHGTLDNPYVFNFANVVTQNTYLVSGNNWFSSFVSIDGEEGLSLIESGLGTAANLIKSQTQYTSYIQDYGWYGSLTEANNEQMYVINMSRSHELTMTGNKVNPAEHPITLHHEWNWIGYPVNQNISVNNAFSGIANTTEDVVKSQFGYSTYYEGFGWFGSLNYMEPGRGYLIFQGEDITQQLVYPSTRNENEVLIANITADNNYWCPNAYKFATNMGLTAVVSIDGEIQSNSNLEVAAFCEGEIRGSARPMYFEPLDEYVVMLTIYGNEGDEITFRLYDVEKNAEYQATAKETFEYTVDAIMGALGNPYVLNFTAANGIGENDAKTIELYPNPAERGETILLNGTCERVEVFNAIGIKVADYQNVNKLNGFNVAGNYVVRITNSDKVVYGKIVVK